MADFRLYRESELKHGRIAMLAVLGLIAGEAFPVFFGDSFDTLAINQYQQAEAIIPAWTFNVVGFVLAVEGYTIINAYQDPSGNGWKDPIPGQPTKFDENVMGTLDPNVSIVCHMKCVYNLRKHK